jgi:type IV pilus assembly protein PilP
MNQPIKLIILICLMGLGLVGCQQEKDDLNTYVAKIKAQQKSDIPPIPVMKPYESFEYAAADIKDPFVPTVIDMQEPKAEPIEDNGLRPDSNRRREALESFELTELQYVGTLEKDKVWALVRAPDGVIHRVQSGNYMGRNHGKITSISEAKLELNEIVPNGRGGYIDRNTSVAAVEVN